MGERRGTKALETWCRRVTQGYPGVKVENMTTSWRDGLAFCAMIHHFRPDLIDFSRLDKADIYGNNELAFRIAERHLGIPALLDAEDMAEYPVPDRLSILTYLSQFYQAFASNSSSPIKKPTSDSPEGSLVSLVQSNVQQSTKMEEGSSLPRREPCVICNNPVFIAQKLRIDGKLYHRTCFRCARCGTQLSLADYYETHDGQYCCETCPDEIIMDKTNLQEKLEEELEIMKEEIEPVINERKILPPEPPPPPIVVNKDPVTPQTRPSASLVAIRRMMFDSYNKDTDDAKLIINKKDLSQNIDSSSQLLIKKPSSDEIIVNNDNIINNNKHYNKEGDIINKSKNEEDTHQFNERRISITDNDKRISKVVDNVNKKLDDNVYKMDNNDKSLPRSKYSNTTEVDSLQVSVANIEERIAVAEEDAEDERRNEANVEKINEEDSLALHTEEVINEKTPLPISDLDTKMNEDIVNEQEETKTDITNNIEDQKVKNNDNVVPSIKTNSMEYPDDLNPFGDDEDYVKEEEETKIKPNEKKTSSNPFGSDSEEDEEEQNAKNQNEFAAIHKSPSLNPFGSDDEEEDIKKPVPLPRKNVLSPEPTPFPRSRLRGSIRSINSLSSTCSLPSPRKKKPAPLPPASPCSTLSRSPKPRKTKRAPLPPTTSTQSLQSEVDISLNSSAKDITSRNSETAEEPTARNKSEIAKEISSIVGLISDMAIVSKQREEVENEAEKDKVATIDNIKTIPEKAIMVESNEESIRKNESYAVTPKRRNSTECDEALAVSLTVQEPISGPKSLNESIGDVSSGNLSYISDNTPSLNNSVCDSLSSPPSEKKNKDSANLHRKISEGGSVYVSKSIQGQWRRKKAPAPPLPLPKRRPVQAMPIQNIRQELHDIEIKQQGLERQGVALENKIRDKFDSESTITPYVEELVLQLFELVNEKNELFRKQAELMYLRRQHHLEEEHSELEFQIRCLMARPEANKTDSDKELEEQLIQRLVEVVERRDAIVQCLEMDRLREAEEDRSINTQLGIFTLAVAKEVKLTTTKKKHKKNKDKQNVLKMMDLDKDIDDSENKETKKKKKWYTLHHVKGKHL